MSDSDTYIESFKRASSEAVSKISSGFGIKRNEKGQIVKGAPQDTNKNGTAGAPTKYKDEFADELVAYFDIEPFERTMVEEEHKVSSKGATMDKIKWKNIANKLPTFEKFAYKKGVSYQTLLNWAGTDEGGNLVHPEFFEAYNTAKFLQKDFIIQNGLQGHYPPAAFIFVAKNVTDMQDIQIFEPGKGFQETRNKIKDFLNEPTDYDSSGESNGSGSEPSTSSATEGDSSVEEPATDIS